MIEKIYIPTVRRAEKQITYPNLPKELQERVVMVVEPGEKSLYQEYYDCEFQTIPEEMVGGWSQLAHTRRFINYLGGNSKYAVIDDDLTILRRNSKYWSNKSNMEGSKRPATHEEILEMFDTFDRWLDEPDIGIVGLSDDMMGDFSKPYVDTVGVFGLFFIDGKKLYPEIFEMDFVTMRVAEDVMFLMECLERGINTRKSNEWSYTNGSIRSDMQSSRVIWKGMFEDKEIPDDYMQSDEHYEALKVIQERFPHAIKIYEKNGKKKNTKYWKKAYRPKSTNTLL